MKRLPPMLVLAVVPLLFLGACGKSSSPQAGAVAGGEILPGSVGDAMLDTSGSQAQAPLAPAALSAPAKADPDASASAPAPASDAPGEAEPPGPATALPNPNPTPSAKPATP